MGRRRKGLWAMLIFAGKAALVVAVLGLIGLGYWIGHLAGMF